MNSKIWLSSPHMAGREMKFIQDAFDTNWIAPVGPNISGFEQDLKAYLNIKNEVVALSSRYWNFIFWKKTFSKLKRIGCDV